MDSSEFIWVPDLHGVHYHRYLLSDCFGSLMIGKRLKGKRNSNTGFLSPESPFLRDFGLRLQCLGSSLMTPKHMSVCA